tara:strand:- start:203265 stop:203381 length:117 start_codon:yes stop_codon:yes gene_type:complete
MDEEVDWLQIGWMGGMQMRGQKESSTLDEECAAELSLG